MIPPKHATAGTSTAAPTTAPPTSARPPSPRSCTRVRKPTAEGPKQGPGSRSRTCPTCGATKGLAKFPRRGPGKRRCGPCKPCEALRVRKHQRGVLYPTATAAGLDDAPGAVRAAAKQAGYPSGFEREVAARLRIFTHHEGTVFLYRDDTGTERYWTPDFVSPSGPVLEVKGIVWPGARIAIEAVRKARPWLDLRFIFQRPHQVGDVQGSRLTPAEWAESIGCRWTSLDRLELVTDGLATERPADELAVLLGDVPDGVAD